jgi:hypothetical protein
MLDRAYAHWLEDGLLEIEGGILLAGVGILRAIIDFVPSGSAAYYWITAGLLVFMIGFAWGAKVVGEGLKRRITYPRTGYAAFKPRVFTRARILGTAAVLVLGGLLGTLVGILATQPDQRMGGTAVAAALGIAGALGLALAANRFSVTRFWYLAAYSLGVGAALGILGVGVVLAVSYYYLRRAGAISAQP